MLTAALGLFAVILLTAATGYFVAQEFAFVAADRSRLSAAAESGDAAAGRALRVIGRLSFMLSGAQLGITMTTLVVGFIAKPALAELIEPLLGATGVPSGAGDAIALAAGFVLATLIQMLLGELFPKNLALARADGLARALAASTLVYLTVAGPLIRLFDRASEKLLRAVGVEPVEELHSGATLEELGDIIDRSAGAGHLPADLSRLLERALSFGDRTADEVMVPRPQVRSLASDATVAELIALIRENGNSNYPVYGQDMDDVIGVVGAREVAVERLAPSTPVSAIARPALMVPGSQPLYGVIERMREAGEEFACVVDEYGGLDGILTFEDIAEELVGEIIDENDAREEAPVGAADGSWLLDAGLRVDEIELTTGLALPEGDSYDTVGGLVMAELRRLPRPGDRLVVPLGEEPSEPDGHAEIEVVTVARRVARQVRVRALAPAEALAAEATTKAETNATAKAEAGAEAEATAKANATAEAEAEAMAEAEAPARVQAEARAEVDTMAGAMADARPAATAEAVDEASPPSEHVPAQGGPADPDAGADARKASAVEPRTEDASAMAASGEGPWIR
ncbi:hemolysin family protein [Actinomadura gamaensis]|uniref:Hemolysin family protein n=1 Tax=Actinomadura gamaensis TaxID=1763541 RepID=A0ABV9U7K1_9ACTN